MRYVKLVRAAVFAVSLLGAVAYLTGFENPAAHAQAGLGSLAGTITDASKAVVPNATVTLINQGTGNTRTVTTNSTGGYRFFALEVSSGYVLHVSAPGFKDAEYKGIATSVGTVITVDVTLQVGTAGETVTVSATNNVEQVQTETAAISNLIDSEIWQNSPLESRTQNTFVLLTAGATPDSGTGRGASVDGARTGTGNFLVGGMDNNDQGLGGGSTSGSLGGGGAVTTISPDAIEEYRVISHNLPAEYGRAGGFATDTVLKSGTKTWHGSLFEYNRVQALAAEHYFTKRGGGKDALVRNQFGGSIGGPVYKNKTFFYATVELHRMRTGSPTTNTTTTPDFLNFVDSGAFRAFMEGTAGQDASVQTIDGVDTVQMGVCPILLGTPCPGALPSSATLGPVFKKLQAAEPTAFPTSKNEPVYVSGGYWTTNMTAPDGSDWPSAPSGVVSIRYPFPIFATTTKTVSEAFDQNRGSLKLDHALTTKDQLSFAYLLDQFNDMSSNGAGGGSPFGPSGGTVGGAQNFSTTWTHTFSPSLLNLFRAGYLRHVNNVQAPGTQGVPMIYTLDPLVEGFGAYSGFPQLFTENEFLYQDSITKTLSRHAFKAGFSYIRTRNGSSFYNDIYGTLLPWDTENLLTDATMNDELEAYAFDGPVAGSLGQAGASIDPTTNQAPDPYRGFRSNEIAAYIQDDWKPAQRLTLNLGVRWDYFGPPHNFRKGFDSNVYFGAFGTPTPNGNPFLPNTAFVGGVQGAKFEQRDSQIWNKDVKSIGPRIGFSYDAFGNGKLAIRGGYGIGYDRLYNNVYENIRFNYPHFSDNTIGGYVGSPVPAGALLQPGLYAAPFTANALFKDYGGKPIPRHIDQRLVNAYYEQYNLGFEYEVKQGYVVEMNYVGTLGRKLVGLQNINLYAGRTACPAVSASKAYKPGSPCYDAGYPTGFSSGRISSLFNNDNFRTNAFGSNYNGFQASFRKGYADGLQFMANYTYSKALDEVSDVFYQRNSGTGPTNPYRPAYDYGPADFDMKHNLVVTLNYETQWKKKNLLLGGWGISPILKLNSGTPFTPSDGNSSYNPIKDGRTGLDRSVYLGQGSPKNAITHSQSPATGYLKAKSTGDYFGPYTCPHSQLWCEPPVGRNSLTGPAYKNLDLGVSKRFPTWEHQGFTLAGNFFNIFNHSNFDNPNADFNSGNYGKSLGTGDPRVTQLSLRYDF